MNFGRPKTNNKEGITIGCKYCTWSVPLQTEDTVKNINEFYSQHKCIGRQEEQKIIPTNLKSKVDIFGNPNPTIQEYEADYNQEELLLAILNELKALNQNTTRLKK